MSFETLSLSPLVHLLSSSVRFCLSVLWVILMAICVYMRLLVRLGFCLQLSCFVSCCVCSSKVTYIMGVGYLYGVSGFVSPRRNLCTRCGMEWKVEMLDVSEL